MEYRSTRGAAPILDFEQATLCGLAQDGGLYVPASWPVMNTDAIRDLQGRPYSEIALCILGLFTGDRVAEPDLGSLIRQAYAGFHHDAIAPIRQLDDRLFLMELFHGPTLAFKDLALQVLGRLFQHFLEKGDRTCTILGATSGDTGSAAIAGVRGLDSVELFMLHPHGRVSDVQRRQMTTVLDGNIHNIAIDGTFDDCQNLVKTLFNDPEFRSRHALTAVNSINWARIASQVVYYFRAALVLGAPDREISFSVPTGNFGNVLAGYVAKKLGLPVHKLIIGSNENDILTRFFETGHMQQQIVRTTLSPSMDIGISSNFERYLFELLDHDADHLSRMMSEFSRTGQFQVGPDLLKKARSDFSAYRFDDDQVRKDILSTYRTTGEIVDPHSMIGVSAARREAHDGVPVVILGTAHPAKFPDAIRDALDIEIGLPDHVAGLLSMTERCTRLGNDPGQLKRFIDDRQD